MTSISTALSEFMLGSPGNAGSTRCPGVYVYGKLVVEKNFSAEPSIVWSM